MGKGIQNVTNNINPSQNLPETTTAVDKQILKTI